MNFKVSGSTPQIPLRPLESQNTPATDNTKGSKSVSSAHQFSVSGQDVGQHNVDTSGKFARNAGTKAPGGFNLFNLQLAEGLQPLEITKQAPIQAMGPVRHTETQNVNSAQSVQAPKLTEAQQKEETIKKFYTAMQNRDLEGIMDLYHPEATFSDPAFPNLKGKKLKNMWKLITSAEPLEIKFRDVKANADGSVSGHWDADYELIKGNPILNQIDSKFEFKDGKIIKHTDSFDFSKWADQAFPGFLGKLIGTRPGKFLMQKVFLPFAVR